MKSSLEIYLSKDKLFLFYGISYEDKDSNIRDRVGSFKRYFPTFIQAHLGLFSCLSNIILGHSGCSVSHMDSMRPLGDLDKTLHVKMYNRIRVDLGSSLVLGIYWEQLWGCPLGLSIIVQVMSKAIVCKHLICGFLFLISSHPDFTILLIIAIPYHNSL